MALKKYLLLCLCLPCMVQAKNITITRLTCEMQEGLVVVEGAPRLGWVMESPENGTRQSAYEIDIREAFTGRQIWNSGKVNSSQSQLVSTEGANIGSDNPFNYVWRVRVWDETDTPSEWSREAKFRSVSSRLSNGKWIGAITRQNAHLPEGRKFHGSELKKPEVKAAWEAVDTLAKKSIYLRRTFLLDDTEKTKIHKSRDEFRNKSGNKSGKKIAEATAYVCGLGFYEFYLNGKKVGNSEFAPLWSDYDKSVYYNTYDVTEQLRYGENAVGILLGNGFYNVQGGRYRKLQISFGPPTLLFELVINYEDGTRTIVRSDNEWKYDLSPVTFNCIYGGEDYDARREQKGWNQTGFDDSHWRPVVMQEAPKGVLRPQMAPPVKIMERYDTQKVSKLDTEQVAAASKSTKRTVDPSAFVLDMGQNLAGFPEITVRGKRGQKITLLVAEALTDEGACNQRQTGRQHYYEYTLKGDGDETWHPRFSYYGFRYIQVEGAVLKGQKNPHKLPVLKNIQSCFVYNSAKKVSTFESSNPIFNAAHRLIEKAVRSNMQSVFTDCPHREKLGWLEQVHLNGPGLLYNYDLTAYASQIMQNMADAQHSNGAMPTTAPEYVVFEGPGMDAFAESPEWGGSLVIFPFMYYETYGDDSLIKKYYPNMRRYVDYLKTRADNGILSFGLGDWYDYGDFRAGFSRNTPVPLVATAHYYMTVMYLIEAAKMVGNDFDIRYYSSLADDIRIAFDKRFLNNDTAQYGTGSQCSNALPLFLHMTQDKKVFMNLLKDIEAHGNRLTTGDVGNRYLIQALARNGRHELIYKMFNHEEAPGYGFQLKFGATTLTEQWDPRQGSSWNHFMMGQIDEWFFNSLAGIRPNAASGFGNQQNDSRQGYQKFVIAPKPVGDLKFVNSSYETLYGTIVVDWIRKDGTFTLNISVPVNTTAVVYLPGEKEPKEVQSGTYKFVCAE
ncbi:glycoside hydrolase family 78 protein [uncultured Bacteroides sp.]|uniref:glycoside hydrolase family 78 protein n=1 Tax=uncultured Bacteroides sp. TaxID=162156 RepID=UPI00280A8304|nr:glycoside hydrolase family 78 protein [uncultured Bacteroides sp.]